MADGGTDGSAFAIRRATDEELSGVLGVLDGANLETDADAIRSAIERDAVLVAASADSGRSSLLGVLVLDGDEITHVAVRRRRRGQGIGTALVEAAIVEHEFLTARFDGAVRPFYETLGFDVEPAEADGRYVGRLATAGV